MKKLALNTLLFLFAALSLAGLNAMTVAAQNAVNQADKNSFVTLISQYRATKGLGALTMDETLRVAAQNYADVLEQTGKTGQPWLQPRPTEKP